MIEGADAISGFFLLPEQRWVKGIIETPEEKARIRNTVDGRNPANQLRLILYPIIYGVLYIPGGAGFCFINSTS